MNYTCIMAKRTLIAAIIAALFLGCTTSKDPKLTKEEQLLEDAKQCMQVLDLSCASEKFAALPDSADYSASKKAGNALVQLMQWTRETGKTLVSVAELFDNISDSSAPQYEILASLEGSSFLNRAIYNLMIADWNSLNLVVEAFDAVTSLPENFSINFGPVPIVIGDIPVVVLQGEMTRTDFVLLQSWMHVGLSFFATALATDFEIPLGALIKYGQTVDECRANREAVDGRICASKLTAFAIHNSSNALGAEPNRGAHFRGIASEQFKSFFAMSHRFLTDLQNESKTLSAQALEKRMLRWTGAPGQGGWVNFTIGEIELDIDDIKNLFDGTQELEAPYTADLRTVRFVVDPGVIEGNQNVVNHFESESPKVVPIATSILPMFTTAAEVLLQSDAIIRLLQIIMSSLDPEFAAIVADVAETVADFYTDFESADAVHNLFNFLLPPSLSLDLNTFFTQSEHLRVFLPDAVTTGTFGERFTYEWQVDWECDAREVEYLLCPTSSVVQDSSHFTDTTNYMPKDGFASRVGYVGYSDPSLGGILYVDPWELDPTHTAGLIQPDLVLLNELIQDIGLEFDIRFGFIQ